MIKWEYDKDVIFYRFDDELVVKLNEYGHGGWEVIKLKFHKKQKYHDKYAAEVWMKRQICS